MAVNSHADGVDAQLVNNLYGSIWNYHSGKDCVSAGYSNVIKPFSEANHNRHDDCGGDTVVINLETNYSNQRDSSSPPVGLDCNQNSKVTTAEPPLEKNQNTLVVEEGTGFLSKLKNSFDQLINMGGHSSHNWKSPPNGIKQQHFRNNHDGDEKFETIAILEHSSLSTYSRAGKNKSVEHRLLPSGNDKGNKYGSMNGIVYSSGGGVPMTQFKESTFCSKPGENDNSNELQNCTDDEEEEDYSTDFDEHYEDCSETSGEMPPYFYGESDSESMCCDMDSLSNEDYDYEETNTSISNTESGRNTNMSGDKDKNMLCNIRKPKFLRRVFNFIFSPTPATPQNTPGTTPGTTPQHSRHASTQEMHNRLEHYANRSVFIIFLTLSLQRLQLLIS